MQQFSANKKAIVPYDHMGCRN